MLDFQEKEKDKWDCSVEERMKKAEEFKAKGNEEFKKGNFQEAQKQYELAFDWVDTGDSEKEEQKKLKINIANNLAASYMKLKGYY